MAALTSSGPNFFDLQDDDGNTFVYKGNNVCAMEKLDWSLGRWTNLFIVPSAASDLMTSAFMFLVPSVSTITYRAYWGGGGWETNAINSATASPATALAPTQIVSANSCGYYVQQGTNLFMQKPDTKTGFITYGTTPVAWNIRPTTGQAFLLKNPVDGTYVVLQGTIIGSTKTETDATVFENVNGYIVVYNTYSSKAATVIAIINSALAAADPPIFTVSTLTSSALQTIAVGGGPYNVTTPGVLSLATSYMGMPTASNVSAFPTLTEAAQSLVPVQPPASMVTPTLMYIYAYGVGVGANYANPTPYTFLPSVKLCKTRKLSAGATAGIVCGVFAVAIIGCVISWFWVKYEDKKQVRLYKPLQLKPK